MQETPLEKHACKKLESIFHEYAVQPSDKPNLYNERARWIINAIKRHCVYEDDFKHKFWKILYNLKLKGQVASSCTLADLFSGRWKTAEDFVCATDDELDADKARFRHQIRNCVFERMKRTNDFISVIDKHEQDGGLKCPKCSSIKTEYSLLQTSSGDEGSTARCLCLTCMHRWRFR